MIIKNWKLSTCQFTIRWILLLAFVCPFMLNIKRVQAKFQHPYTSLTYQKQFTMLIMSRYSAPIRFIRSFHVIKITNSTYNCSWVAIVHGNDNVDPFCPFYVVKNNVW